MVKDRIQCGGFKYGDCLFSYIVYSDILIKMKRDSLRYVEIDRDLLRFIEINGDSLFNNKS